MRGGTQLQVKVVGPAEVEAVYEGSVGGIGLGILPFVAAEVAVLVDELPEVLAVGIVGEMYLAVVGGNIDKV